MSRWFAAVTTPSPPGDIGTLSQIIAKDATEYQPGSGDLAGERKGVRAILEFYGRLAAETDSTFRVQIDRLYTDGMGRVVATHRATAQRAGRRLDAGASLIFTIIDGPSQLSA